ncbi:MAG: LytR C-terminal domain-containing protein [Actinobacteria bacterium]|nr:LytR C-terminal domain-containing protein [Actinomycetota bacterium]
MEEQKIGTRMERRLKLEKRRKRKIFTIFITLLMIFISIFFFSYLRNCLSKPGKETAQEQTTSSTSEEEQPTSTEEELVFSGKTKLLIIGSDKSLEQISPNSVILTSYNSISEESLLLSIPLRTMLQFSGEAVTVQQLLKEGRIEDLKSAINDSIGIEVDHYILINVFDLVEKIGGVSVNIPENISFPDINTDVTVLLEKGEKNLSGDLAISYLHYISGEGESILHVSDQQDVYLSILDKLMANKSYSEIANEMQLISEYFASDFSVEELISLGSSMTRLQESKIFKDKTLPIIVAEIDGNNYHVPQPEKITEIFGEFESVVTPEEKEKSDIIILNGCGSPGIANSAGNKLQNDFQIVEIGNAASFQYTETKIIVTSFKISVIEDAISIRELLGVGKIVTDGSLSEQTRQKANIVIIIGSDYLPLS